MKDTEKNIRTMAPTLGLAALVIAGLGTAMREIPGLFGVPLNNLLMFGAPVMAFVMLRLWNRNPRFRARLAALLRWRWTPWISLAGAMATALYFAIHSMWVGDDAFISFRYADNLAHGHGLVFNIGERVEGYTNFLWTVILAGAIRLHLPAPETAVVLNLVFMTGALLVVNALVRRLDPLAGRSGVALAIAPWLLALSYPFTSFGTSGLETPMATFLVCAGLYAWIARPNVFGAFLSGLLLILATLSRPDHALFYISMGIAIALVPVPRKRSDIKTVIKHLAAFALPFALVYLPYFAWRYSYYGYLFPNTYYAKMADQTNFAQGFIYFKTFILAEGYWLLIPFFIVLQCVKNKGRALGQFTIFSSLSIALTTLYVLKVGGDFMHGRFFVPLIPLFMAAVELNGRQWLLNTRTAARDRRFAMLPGHLWPAALLVLMLGLSLACCHPRPQEQKLFVGYTFIGDEPTWYPVTRFHPMVIDNANFIRGKTLGLAFKDMRDKPLYATLSVGMEGYYSGLPLLDGYGLTDAHIAHQPFEGERGRPGHERHPGAAYYRQRNPLLFLPKFMPVPFEEYLKVQALLINDVPVYMSYYQPDMLKRLEAKPGLKVQYLHFPEFLEYYLANTLPAVNTPQAARDFAFFKAYYFDYNPDPALLERFRDALTRKQETAP